MNPWDYEETVPLAQPSALQQESEEATSRLTANYDPQTGQYDYDQDDAASEVGQLFDGADGPSHGGRNALIIVLAVVLVIVLIIVAYPRIRDAIGHGQGSDYPSSSGSGQVTVTIPMGASSTTVGSILQGAGVIKSQQTFVNAAKSDAVTWGNVQSGTYTLNTQISAEQALQALADPSSRVRTQFTIIEGMHNSQVYDAINKATGVSVSDLQAAAADPTSIGLPPWATSDTSDPSEGYLFPDTYEYGANPTATSVLTPMGSKFNSVVTSLQFVSKANDEGLTPTQAVVLASIVQMEGTPQDMPQVAQVFLNRLAQNMPLQSDATVAYANNNYSSVWTTDAERALDSPFNTYKYNGLPPGAICNPGQDALSAVVNPSGDDTILYFTVVNLDTGETKFAATLAEQNQNVAELNAWCASTKSPKCN